MFLNSFLMRRIDGTVDAEKLNFVLLEGETLSSRVSASELYRNGSRGTLALQGTADTQRLEGTLALQEKSGSSLIAALLSYEK